LCVIFYYQKEDIMPSNHVYGLTRQLIRFYARLMLKLDVRFHGTLPAGPKLFIANHPSASDPFLMPLLLPKHLSVLVTSNAFEMPLFGYFLHQCRQISVIPGRGKDALDQAELRLKSGQSVGIFPEGLVSPHEGGYHSGRSGAARLALSTGVPVVPVGIYLPRERNVYISSRLSGKHTAAYWYLRGPYGMTIGEPEQFRGDPEDQGLVYSVTARLMERIHILAEESERRVCFSPSGLKMPAI
jgi:1-acyl-sn-glycerol-3-phosphate acyltransferase